MQFNNEWDENEVSNYVYVSASPPTQYRLFGRWFYRSKDPTNSIKVLKEDQNIQITQIQ